MVLVARLAEKQAAVSSETHAFRVEVFHNKVLMMKERRHTLQHMPAAYRASLPQHYYCGTGCPISINAKRPSYCT